MLKWDDPVAWVKRQGVVCLDGLNDRRIWSVEKAADKGRPFVLKVVVGVIALAMLALLVAAVLLYFSLPL